MITKEICRDYALKVKEETGKFPLSVEWIVKNGFPCGSSYLLRLFNGYNNFRNYCGEQHLVRTSSISLDWVKSNCTIDNNECWNWNNSVNDSGYGKLTLNRKQYRVHRITYELVNGKIEDKLLVRHKCDNRKCCNPDHLELGNKLDNTLDFQKRKESINYSPNLELAWTTRRLETLEEKIQFYLKNIKIVNACWLPTVLKPTIGKYYRISHQSKLYTLHKLLLANKLKKEYTDIDIARHVCNNRSCINPEHLVEGTNSDNFIDSKSYSKLVKLTEENVVEIRTSLLNTTFSKIGDKGKFDKFWANKLNVSPGTISGIRLNKTWKDIII